MRETSYGFESLHPHHFIFYQNEDGIPNCIDEKQAPVAQLDRALDYGSRGYGFNSCPARQLLFYLLRDVAQLGSAPGLGPGGRRFKSCHPDQIFFIKTGGLAQLARAFGSYPKGREFESLTRYQFYLSELTVEGPLAQLVRATGS